MNYNNTQKEVIRIISDILNLPEAELTPEKSFTNDLGCDSLDLMEIITVIEKNFNLKISDQEAEKVKTLEDLLNHFKDE